MSFVVSINGQFRPYQLPDLSRFDRVSRVYKSPETPATQPEHDSAETLEESTEHSSKKHKLKAFTEVDAEFQKERSTLYAKDLMSSPVHTVIEGESLNSLEETFDKYSIRHLPVVNNKNILVGIVSDRDFLKSKKTRSVLVKDIMTQEVLTAQHTARIVDVAKLMLHEKIGAMPVVDHTHSLVGIVTLTDILSAIVRQGGL